MFKSISILLKGITKPDCLLFITDMMTLFLPTRLSNSSLQTLSDKEMLKTFLQSHMSQLSSPRTSSFFKIFKIIFQLDSSRDDEASNTVHIARRLPAGLHLFQEVIRKWMISTTLNYFAF